MIVFFRVAIWHKSCSNLRDSALHCYWMCQYSDKSRDADGEYYPGQRKEPSGKLIKPKHRSDHLILHDLA